MIDRDSNLSANLKSKVLEKEENSAGWSETTPMQEAMPVRKVLSAQEAALMQKAISRQKAVPMKESVLIQEAAPTRATVPAVVAGNKSAGARRFTALWAGVGMVSFVLGALGAILPLIPTTPFLLFAAFCFARSSQRLERWFRSTKLCKTVLEGYVSKRAMTLKAKLMLLVPLTGMLGISFVLMTAVPVGRMVVASIWVVHVVYFGFVVKTDRSLKISQQSETELPPVSANAAKREGV